MTQLSTLLKAIRNPSRAVHELRHRYHDWLNSRRGIRFLHWDWDNLILLDGCRFDIFQRVNTIDGDLAKVMSNASSSQGFFRKNFEGGEFGDLVYYSANPHIDLYDFQLYGLFRLWETDFDGDTGTVLPQSVVERVLDSEQEFRDKRIIIHFMQPHRPFLGKHAEDFQQPGFAAKGVNVAKNKDPDVPFWWDRLQEGHLDEDDIWTMYRQTLEITLPEVQKLINSLPGKSVISADHGNAFGEAELYGHPTRTHHPVLACVPWLEIDGHRKPIVEDAPLVRTKREHFNQAEEQLAALGYK